MLNNFQIGLINVLGSKKYYFEDKVHVSASRLVKSPDSHASDPCSRLGGSSWLCYGIISLQSSMKCEKFISGATLREKRQASICQRANSKVLGPAVYKNIAEFNEIENSSPYNGKSGHTDHEAKSRRCRQFPMIILSFGNIVVNRGAVGESRTSGRRGKTP